MKLYWGRHSINQKLPFIIRWQTVGTDALDLNRSGVFLIKNIVNGKMYIGMTCNIQRRYDIVTELLNKNLFKDVCPKLQIEYNLYGKDNIHFTPREICINPGITYKRWVHISNHYQKLIGDDKVYRFEIGRQQWKQLVKKN